MEKNALKCNVLLTIVVPLSSSVQCKEEGIFEWRGDSEGSVSFGFPKDGGQSLEQGS